MSIIFVHGSVETSTAPEYIHGLEVAAQKGYVALKNSGDKLRAVEAAVNELEDNPLYSAGLGSVLNRDGYVEVDGSIMDGTTGKFAGIAVMRNIRHAISVAKKLMEESEHVLLAGEGATIFAREHGFPYDNCITEQQLASWQKAQELLRSGQELNFSLNTGLPKPTDTVGCVLLDDQEQLAAGSSTGGAFLKHPGRVGDTPIIGGGIYTSRASAVVCTGKGEAFIQTLTAKYVDDGIQSGKHPEDVAREAIQRVYQLTGHTGGVLVVDQKGRYAAAHNCNMFPIALAIDGKITKVDPIYVEPK